MAGAQWVVVLGASGVGKSSLVVAFVQGVFAEEYNPTIEDIYTKLVELEARVFHECILLEKKATRFSLVVGGKCDLEEQRGQFGRSRGSCC